MHLIRFERTYYLIQYALMIICPFERKIAAKLRQGKVERRLS